MSRAHEMEDPSRPREMEDPSKLREMEDPNRPREMEDPNRLREMEDPMKTGKDDNSKAAQGNRREDAQNKAEEQMTQQWTQFKETVYQKLRGMYKRMTTASTSFVIDASEMADPLDVGTVAEQSAMLNMKHENVQFEGLHSATNAAISVDTDSQEATLTMSLSSAEISGNYIASDADKTVSGKFNVRMFGDVSYVSTFHYQQDGGNVQLMQSSGKLSFGTLSNQYENAGLPKFILSSVQTRLLRAVNEKIQAELSAKVSGRVQQYIQEVISGHQQQDPIDKLLRDGIKNAVNGIQQVLAKRGLSSIELTSNDKEMVYNKLHAKIASVKLNGVDKLYLANNQVSKEESNKIRATLRFAIDRPTATAVVNIHETHDENAPFQKINVDFDMEQLMAELGLEKMSRQSGLSLRSFQTKVNRMRPIGIEKFDGEVSNMIREKLTGHMKHYVEDGLNTFIQQEYAAINSQGVLPPSLEN